ncbi:MAG: phosphoribosylpyrophosphate synthetase [Bacteroidota bacterium]|nr:phosphoribosylpyrophosphate synthetase [Bacteroidota bacterium]
MEKEMNTLTETIEKFKAKQFIHDFCVKETLLMCEGTKESFRPEDVVIERTGRYEGDSNPDDMSVIYAITTNTGTQGVLIDAYGTYANPQIAEFIKNIPKKEKAENQV